MSTLAPEHLRSDHFWSLLELATDGMWWWRIETDEVRWSPSLARSFGYAEDDRALADILELTHPDDREAHRAAVEAHLQAGGAYDAVFRFRQEDGSYRWVRSRGMTTRDPEGRPLVMFGYVIDISEERERMNALRASEARFRAFIEHSPAATFLTDESGRYLTVNAAASTLISVPPHELVGHRVSDLAHPETVEIIEDLNARVLASDAPAQWVGPVRRVDGSERWVHNVKFPVELDGGARAVGGFVLDLTDLRRAELAAEAAQRLESLGRLAGGVAHDFNNLLTVILGHARLAALEVGPGHAAGPDLDEIIDAAERSAELTAQLLAFARRQEARPDVVDLRERIGATLSLLGRLIGEDVELDVRIEPRIWPVRMDPSHLDQVLTNLCVNARDAMPRGGRIVIGLRNVPASCSVDGIDPAPGDRVLLSVADEGVGMEPALLENVFEPFFTTKATGEGTGLGLATVHGIVSQAGGTVDVRSAPGEGSDFRILLPREFEAPVDTVVRATAPEVAPISGTVLLVEDSPGVLRLTTRMLTSLGYDVLAAGSPNQALQIMGERGEDVDVLVTDVVMPGMNGPDLAEEVQRMRPRVQTVYISGHAREHLTGRGVDEDPAGFVQKPFTLETLGAAVRDAVEAARG
ncbi:MAG TPA: PAS domain S-box protein [Longimicrobiales bacterium]|nr:PAS domain S-box protein [Longimicrobiales bacterium]